MLYLITLSMLALSAFNADGMNFIAVRSYITLVVIFLTLRIEWADPHACLWTVYICTYMLWAGQNIG